MADSLSALELDALPREGRLADLGAGAGFPGLVLAIALPSASLDLVESARRKCEVIRRLAAAAGVTNARALPERAEELAAGEGREAYEAVTARALGSLPLVLEYAAPLLRERGALVAWKGTRDPDEESAAAAAAEILGMAAEEIRPVVPFPGARDLHLHVWRKLAPTPERFPRRAGIATKRPLA